MNARDDLLDEYGRADTAPLGTLAELRAKLDAIRAEGLREAAEAVAQHTGNPIDASAQMLRRLADERAGCTEPAELTVYRASHDSIVMGLYTTAEAARAHCEADMRRDLPTVSLDWIEDEEEEDCVAELVAAVGEDERPTGFVVTALAVASAYDEDGDA